MKNKKTIIFFLIVTAIVLYLTLKDDFFEILEIIITLNPFWIIISFLLLITFWFFRAKGLYELVKPLYPESKFKKIFSLNLITQFFNLITPYSLGGHPVQVNLMKKEDISYADGSSITIQNFIVYQIALVIIQTTTVILCTYFKWYGSNVYLNYLGFFGLVIDILIVVGLFVLAFSRKFSRLIIRVSIWFLVKFRIVKNKEEKLKEWNLKIRRFHDSASLLYKYKKNFRKAVINNIFALLLLYLIPLTVLYATGDYTSFTPLHSIVLTSYVMMFGDYVPLPGGTGGVEFGFTSLFGPLVTKSAMLSIMLVWRFITYYIVLIIGLIVFQRNDIFKNKEE